MKTYQGSCHCGAVAYEVQGEFKQGMTCNCSICSRAGWVLLFVGDDQFRLLRGEDQLTDYQFGKKKVHHPFCRVCGVRSFGHGKAPDGSAVFSVNARCLRDLDFAELTIEAFDGAAL